MRKILLVAASAAIVGGAACKTLGKAAFAEPKVALKDVRIRGIGLTGGQLDVMLSVYNPNNYRLDATRLTYRVMLSDNVTLATGVVDSRFTVQNNDSTTVPIPVTFTYSGIGEAGRQLLNMGAVNYKVDGDVTVGTVVVNFTVPYSSNGRFTTSGVAR